MAERSITRQLFDLAAPIIGLNVMTVLALAVDTAMCGRLPEADVALAGLGFATQVTFLLMVAQMGLTVGTIALVARAYGAREHDRVEHVLRQSTQLTVLVALVVATAGNGIAPLVIRAMGAQGEELRQALLYLRPLLTGTVFYYLILLFAGVLRGVGNTKLPFWISLLTNVLNFGFNYGLILGNYGLPALGVQGAALGTLASFAIGVVAYVLILRSGVQEGLTIKLRPTPIDRPLARELVRIGLPAAMDMVILNAAFLSIIGMLGRISPAAVAGHGVGLRVQALAFVPGMSVSQATAAMVGQALGANDVERANAVVRASLKLCVLLMTSLCVLILTGAYPITALFGIEAGEPITEYTVTWMKVLGYGMPIVGIWIAFVGMLQGSGHTRTSLRINLVATTAQIPLSWLLGFPLGLGPLGIWIAFPISFAIKAVWGWIEWRRGRWATTGSRA